MASLWPPYGLLMASLWHPYGLILASLWPPYGLLMASLWPPYGLLMASLWHHAPPCYAFSEMLFISACSGRGTLEGPLKGLIRPFKGPCQVL